jgi:hypothetical protein
VGINGFAALALLLYVGMALFLLTPMVRAARRQKLQSTWPRVPAVVTAHRISSETLTSCRQFRVQFDYDGQRHDRWVSDPDGGWDHATRSLPLHLQEEMRRTMTRLAPVGSELQVMINPQGVDEAYYVARQLPAKAIAVASATVFVTFFALFVYLALQ